MEQVDILKLKVNGEWVGVPALQGETGVGIVSITKISTEGLVDTYRILYSNGTATTFTVTNGEDGAGAVESVNGQTGTVVLDASDVGAYPSTNPDGYTSNVGTVTSVNNTSPDGNGNVTISIPTVDIDGETITKNGDDELQTVAVIDNRSGNAIKTWTGTKQQYDAIVTKDSNTLYNITDDTDVTQTLLNLLYPVGAIYIGTMATCPLTTLGIGTWQLVATDRVLQGAGTRGSVGSTVNESLPNLTGEVSKNGEYGFISDDIAGTKLSGVFKKGTQLSNATSGATITGWAIGFDASLSSSTYQDDAPVQQDAYLVNIWERTA